MKKNTEDVLIQIIINKLEKAVLSVYGSSIHISQIQADWEGEFRNSELIIELNQ